MRLWCDRRSRGKACQREVSPAMKRSSAPGTCRARDSRQPTSERSRGFVVLAMDYVR